MGYINDTSSLFADLRDAIKKASDALYESICKIRTFQDEDQAEIEQQIEEAQAAVDVIPFDVMLEKLKEMDERPDPEMLRMSSMFWGEDARIFNEKAAARQREILRAMQDESARQAMKRRKLLHNEGSFPEWAR
jgi:hypothetical protein